MSSNKSPHSRINDSRQVLEPALWFIFQNEDILFYISSDVIKIPDQFDNTMLNLDVQQQLYIGMYGDTHCYAAQVCEQTATKLLPGMEFCHIRRAYAAINDDNLFLMATKALQVLHWDKRTKYCGVCGNETTASESEHSKICQYCQSVFFPQISPAVLILITHEKKILLGRSAHFLPEIYSILAGFVEPGETLEQCVIREVKEEVNLIVKNIRYFGSQPWPFPSNLMIGFLADYESGEIEVNKDELEDAQWFSSKNLPKLPNKMSLSRLMIDEYVRSIEN